VEFPIISNDNTSSTPQSSNDQIEDFPPDKIIPVATVEEPWTPGSDSNLPRSSPDSSVATHATSTPSDSDVGHSHKINGSHRRTATDKESFVCELCQKDCPTRGDLNKHKNRKHEKRYTCDFPGCLQAPFGLRRDMLRHQEGKHSRPGSNIVARCNYGRCQGKSFTREDNFKRHLRRVHQMRDASL